MVYETIFLSVASSSSKFERSNMVENITVIIQLGQPFIFNYGTIFRM